MKIIEHPKGEHLPRKTSKEEKIQILLATELRVAKFSTFNEDTNNFEDFYLPHFGDHTIGASGIKTGFKTPEEAYDYGKKLKKEWPDLAHIGF